MIINDVRTGASTGCAARLGSLVDELKASRPSTGWHSDGQVLRTLLALSCTQSNMYCHQRILRLWNASGHLLLHISAVFRKRAQTDTVNSNALAIDRYDGHVRSERQQSPDVPTEQKELMRRDAAVDLSSNTNGKARDEKIRSLPTSYTSADQCYYDENRHAHGLGTWMIS